MARAYALACDVLEKINLMYSGFSKSQKKIADFIVKNYDKAAFMTAAALSKTVGVSCSTVVRFAVELGFDGYPSLTEALQNLARTKLTSVQRMEVTSSRMGNSDILSTILNYDISNIKETLEEIDKKAFESALLKIANAKKVYVIGYRSSSALAQFLYFYLNLIFDNIVLVGVASIGEMYEELHRICEDDVLIAISFPRYSSRTVKAVNYANDNGAKVVAITDSEDSPISQLATHTLLAKSNIASFVDSLVAPLSVINALIAGLGMIKKDDVYGTFEELEKIWTNYDVFKQSENSYGK